MIYGFVDGKEVIVAAADSVTEFDSFCQELRTAVESGRTLVESADFATPYDMMADDRFQKMTMPPLVLVTDTSAEAASVATTLGITVVKRNAALNKHVDMVDAVAYDPYHDDSDNAKTIAETYNLEKDDPWDKRTDEQKERDEANRKAYEEAKKRGDLSGDSWGGGKKKDKDGKVLVERVRASTNADGSINIDDVLAHKIGGEDGDASDDAGDGSIGPFGKEHEDEVGLTKDPKDYIFAANLYDVWGDGKNTVVISVAPKKYFDENGCMYDQHLTPYLEASLPKGMDEMMESTFEWPTIPSIEHAIDELEARGFVHSKAMQDIIDDGIADEEVAEDPIQDVRDSVKSMIGDIVAQVTGKRPEPEAPKTNPFLEPPAPEVDDNFSEAETEDLEIDTKGAIAIYYKVEVENSKLADITKVLAEGGFDLKEKAVKARNNAAGCWAAFPNRARAEEAGTILTAAGLTVEVYGVNDAGERLAPKGVDVVDTVNAEPIGPRPWNDRAAEIDAMDDDAKAKNKDEWKKEEFIYCGTYEGAEMGCIIYIAPETYFDEHDDMFPTSLNIEHLLPRDIKELRPGVYQTRSRDWVSTAFALSQAGFKESLALQLWLNRL